MSRRRITESYDNELLNTANWPRANLNVMTEQDLETYKKRKKAVEMFIKGDSLNEIKIETGIDRKEINSFFKKCLYEDKFGIIYGFNALIPGKTIKQYNRKELPNSTSKKQYNQQSGAFRLLLKTYPVLQELIDTLFFKNKNKSLTDPVMKKNRIHKRFIEKCREQGLKAPFDYPFNTKELAKRSLYSYLQKLEEAKMSEVSYRYNNENEHNDNINSHFNEQAPTHLKPYERVQFDGHKIDLSLSLTFETPSGDEVTKVLDRIWLLVIIDVASRAVLGYYISLNKEYNSNDVLQCVKKSIEPWKPLNLTIPGLKYPPNGGLPSGLIKESMWALWDEFYYDNAKANLSIIVRDRVKRIINCRVNAGPIKSPTKRSLIERFFGILEENGYHRLPNTTGSNPKDPRRNNPEKQALKIKMNINDLEELTDVLIADYNSTPNEGTSYSTPLEALQHRINKDPIIRKLQEEERDNIPFLCVEAKRKVKGSIEQGRRPYIQFENVRYTNELLLRSPGLIGKTLDLVINIDDVRFLTAYLPDGSELGKLVGSGYWGKTKHSLALRKEIFSLRNKKLIHFTTKDDPIKAFQQYLKEKAITHKRYRNKLNSLEKTLANEQEVTKNIPDTSEREEVNTSKLNNVSPIKINTKDTMPIVELENKKRLKRTLTF
ncbi:hypothetical protein M3172_18995 [Mesobacillus subterraneus]|uniref:hypothetical protein n=1 Tax=Mesobacillus subterraneus TaxID=285983 RepID=UPI00203A66EC|nr:hypothetical protein [Mesobacillus subterraneus]MCM3575289.1 hypothetical protein [Mesobacillus subterraneus]